MSEIPAMNAAMSATVAVLRAAQAMSASSVALLASAAAPSGARAPLPYSSLLDKLA